jgi:hypothetical protein
LAWVAPQHLFLTQSTAIGCSSFGVNPGETGKEEDWHAGSQRLKK